MAVGIGGEWVRFTWAGIEAPTSGFERGGIEEIVVYGDKSLANAISDLGKVASSQLVRDQAIANSGLACYAGNHVISMSSGTWKKWVGVREGTCSSTWIKDIVDAGSSPNIVG